MKIVCLGDSFTKGFGVKKEDNWVSRLRIPDAVFINKGVNGDTTSGMLSRFKEDVVAEKPNYVCIIGGINDFITGSILDIPKNNYMAMAHQAFHHNIIPIVGISPGFRPSQVRDDWAAFSDFDLVLKKHLQLRTWLQDFCKTFGLYSIDFYIEWESILNTLPDDNFYIDGLHLTSEGHKWIADIASNTLKRFQGGHEKSIL